MVSPRNDGTSRVHPPGLGREGREHRRACMNFSNLVQGVGYGRTLPFIQFNLIQPAQPYKRKEDCLVRGIKSRGGKGALVSPESSDGRACVNARYGAREENAEDREAGDRLGLRAFLGVGRTLFPWCRVCSRAVLQGFGCEGVWGEGGYDSSPGKKILE